MSADCCFEIEVNLLRLTWPALCIILFFRLDDRGLLLRDLLNVLPPSVCSILRSGPSGGEEGGRRRELDDGIEKVGV
jgi:hypothetical protein